MKPSADILLMNTCSVRDKAEDKVYSLLGAVARCSRRKRPHLIIGVGGCVASQEGEAILGACAARGPGLRTADASTACRRCWRSCARAAVRRSRRELSRRSRSSTACRRRARKAAPAFVSIMEGCSKFCSYCVVPYTRRRGSQPARDGLGARGSAWRWWRRAWARSRCWART